MCLHFVPHLVQRSTPPSATKHPTLVFRLRRTFQCTSMGSEKQQRWYRTNSVRASFQQWRRCHILSYLRQTVRSAFIVTQCLEGLCTVHDDSEKCAVACLVYFEVVLPRLRHKARVVFGASGKTASWRCSTRCVRRLADATPGSSCLL